MIEPNFRESVSALIPSDGFQIAGIRDASAYVDLLSLVRSQNATTADDCRELVLSLLEVSQGQDLQTQIVLRSLAEGVEWPPYEGGDGYWSEPSDNSVGLVMVGWRLQPDEIELARSILNSGLPGVGFIALGMTRNLDLPRDVILALDRFADPVTVAASCHPSLTSGDVRSLLERVDNGTWVAAFVLGQDGWTWPDWQYAFGEVSRGCPDSAAFWEVVLAEMANPDRWSWFEDFLYEVEESLDYQDLDAQLETFEGLLTAMWNNPNLVPLALASGWTPALVAAAADSSDTATLQQLAVSDIAEVRQSILRNEYATDEIRALAAMAQ